MNRKQIQFTERQLAAIRTEARRRGISEAAVVRGAIDRTFEPAGRPGAARSRQIARAIAAVGGFRSGMRDIAQEHDRELADAFEE